MNQDCLVCQKTQMDKVCRFIGVDDETRTILNQEASDFLDNLEKMNPAEVMAHLWKFILPRINNDNPYKEIKSRYNQMILDIYPQLKKQVKESNDPLHLALKLAIVGNLIDFATKVTFTQEMVLDKFNHGDELVLAIDDSKDLFKQLETSKTLLYLGDNCGEIVADKLFIETIKEHYPHLHVIYGVRGGNIVNDASLDDAREVKMEEVAEVKDNGDVCLGTILHRISKEYKQLLDTSDVVISKGQGNYESLMDYHRENLYLLFMAKCDRVSAPIHVETMSIVCKKQDA